MEVILYEILLLARRDIGAAFYIERTYIRDNSIDFETIEKYLGTRYYEEKVLLIELIPKISPSTLSKKLLLAKLERSRVPFAKNYYLKVLLNHFKESLSIEELIGLLNKGYSEDNGSIYSILISIDTKMLIEYGAIRLFELIKKPGAGEELSRNLLSRLPKESLPYSLLVKFSKISLLTYHEAVLAREFMVIHYKEKVDNESLFDSYSKFPTSDSCPIFLKEIEDREKTEQITSDFWYQFLNSKDLNKRSIAQDRVTKLKPPLSSKKEIEDFVKQYF